MPREQQKQAWALFSPGTSHHVDPSEQESLPLFFDYWLKGKGDWPRTPERVHLISSKMQPLRLTFAVFRPEEIESVKVFYSLNEEKISSRFWRHITAEKPSGMLNASGEKVGLGYSVELPVSSTSDSLVAYVNARYHSGATVSSMLLQGRNSDIKKSVPKLRRKLRIDPMVTDEYWGYVGSYTEPNKGLSYFKPWAGADGEKGFTLNPAMFAKDEMKFWIGTAALNDPQYHDSGATRTLCIDYLAENAPTTLVVKIDDAECTPTLVVGTGNFGKVKWRTIRLRAENMVEKDGKQWENWDKAEFFGLKGTCPPDHPVVFKWLRWEEG
jgi:hypothetical protein